MEDAVKLVKLHLRANCPLLTPSLALDIGTCMIKASYKVESDADSAYCLVLASCNVKNTDSLVKHLKEVKGLEAVGSVKAVGAGVKTIASQFEKSLHIRLENTDQLDRAVRGFYFLQGVLPPQQLLHPICQHGIDAAQPQIRFYKIEQNGSFKVADCTVGGLTFHGLAATIAGKQDIGELLEMATVGDRGAHSSVDVYGRDLKPPDQKDDGYDMFPGDAMSLCLGKCATHPKDSLDPNDVIHGVLKALCRDITLVIHSQALITGIPRIYIGGGLAGTPVVRKLMTENFAVRNFAKPPDAPYVDYQFLQQSDHLACIGALHSE